jgi:hypothetical protein
MAAVAWAQGPYNSGDYYKNADGKKGAALKTALCGIIYNRNENSYDALWNIFKKTDKRIDENGKTLYNKDGDSFRSPLSNQYFPNNEAVKHLE